MVQQDNFSQKIISFHHKNLILNQDLGNVNDGQKYHCEEENFYQQEKH